MTWLGKDAIPAPTVSAAVALQLKMNACSIPVATQLLFRMTGCLSGRQDYHNVTIICNAAGSPSKASHRSKHI